MTLSIIENGRRVGLVTCDDAEGSCVVNGRTWRWTYSWMWGPTFINKDGSDRKRQPGENHPVWKKFYRWQDKWKKENPRVGK